MKVLTPNAHKMMASMIEVFFTKYDTKYTKYIIENILYNMLPSNTRLKPALQLLSWLMFA